MRTLGGSCVNQSSCPGRDDGLVDLQLRASPPNVVLARLLTFRWADDTAARGVSEASTTGAAIEIAGSSRSLASNRDEESSFGAPVDWEGGGGGDSVE